MEGQALDSVTLMNGVELTSGVEIATLKDFQMGPNPGAEFTAGEIFEVELIELIPSEETVIVYLDSAPVDMLDIEALETGLEMRQFAIVDP